MSIKKFNLDNVDLESGFSLHLQSPHAGGKTHFQGDALRYESQFGDVCYLTFPGEDGWRTISNMGLGSSGVLVETYNDLKEFMKELEGRKEPLRALALDSMPWLSHLVMIGTLGDSRLPRIGREDNEWTEVHRAFTNTIQRLRRLGKFVIAGSYVDVETIDPFTGEKKLLLWRAAVPGKQADRSVGMFDFGFTIEATDLGSSGVERLLKVRPSRKYAIRQRLPHPGITEDIKLPHGLGGWESLRKAIAKVYEATQAKHQIPLPLDKEVV